MKPLILPAAGQTLRNQNLRDSVMITISNQLATGLQESALENEMSVFPNPVRDMLSVVSGTQAGWLSLSLYDARGVLTFTKTIQAPVQDMTYLFEMSTVPTNFYFIELRTETGFMVKKLVKD